MHETEPTDRPPEESTSPPEPAEAETDEDAAADEASEGSFPASDPPPW